MPADQITLQSELVYEINVGSRALANSVFKQKLFAICYHGLGWLKWPECNKNQSRGRIFKSKSQVEIKGAWYIPSWSRAENKNKHGLTWILGLDLAGPGERQAGAPTHRCDPFQWSHAWPLFPHTTAYDDSCPPSHGLPKDQCRSHTTITARMRHLFLFTFQEF